MPTDRRRADFEAVRSALAAFERTLLEPLPRNPDGAREHAGRVTRARAVLLGTISEYGCFLPNED